MTPQEERTAMWKALLAAVNEVTCHQPNAHEVPFGDGPSRWSAPYGSSRSPATYSDDGREVSCSFKVWDADENEKTYHLSVRVEGGEQ